MRRSDRSERRAEAKRMKAKAIEKLKAWGFSEDKLSRRMIGIHADNMAICSCTMCGNPRRSGKGRNRLTIQERRCDAEFS